MADKDGIYARSKVIANPKNGYSPTERWLAGEVVRLTDELAKIDKAASSLDRMAVEASVIAKVCRYLRAFVDRENERACMKLMRNEGIEEILPKLAAGEWKKA